MKTFKHITIIASAVTISLALCSAGYYVSTKEKLEQIIPENSPSKELPIKFKSINTKCYRQLALSGMNSVLLGANMQLPETYSSWSFDKSVVENFNGGVPPAGMQGVIFEVDNTISDVEVIINLFIKNENI